MRLPSLRFSLLLGACVLGSGPTLAEELPAGAPTESPLGSAEHETPQPYPSCDEEPSETQVNGAKGAYQAGTVSFQEADYERAILYWEDALRRDCTAAKLLLNLARAYELAGKKEHAVLALETFLERKPDSPDKASIQKRIGHLRAELEKERLAQAQVTQESAPPQPAAEAGAAPARRPAWPVVLTAVGAAAGATGLALFVSGESTLSGVNCTEDTPRVCSPNPDAGTTTPDEEVARASSAQDLRNLGGALAIAGGATAVGGAVLWVVLWNDRPEVARAFTPLVGPDRWGVQLSGRF